MSHSMAGAAIALAFALGLAGPTGQEHATPLERNGFARVTSHRELVEFVQTLDRDSDLLEVRTIGTSGGGRTIPLLVFSRAHPLKASRDGVLTVLVYCQQHGNEPSGMEAALVLAREMAADRLGVLDRLDLLLVPQVNPDGSEAGTRSNAAGADLNRNHVLLTQTEAVALHDVFLEWMPHVTLDVHETNVTGKAWLCEGIMKDAAEQFDGPSNLQVDEGLRRLANEEVVPAIGRRLADVGYSHHRYVVGGPPAVRRIRHSTTDVNDGRQSMAIYQTLSFIVEGKRWHDHQLHLERRTAGQAAALRAFLTASAERAPGIAAAVSAARGALVRDGGGKGDVLVRQDYAPDPERRTVSYPVFDLATWSPRVAELANYEPRVVSLASVTRPWGYAVPAGEERLVALLQRHRLRLARLAEPAEVDAERYRISTAAPAEIEEKDAFELGLEVLRGRVSLPVGTVVVEVRQPAANLIPLLLEPHSTWAPWGEPGGGSATMEDLLAPGTVFPVVRLLAPLGA